MSRPDPALIRIVGPRDQRLLRDAPGLAWTRVDTTSHSTAAWTTELSPFYLGPCELYGGRVARRMENAWQFAKVFPQHVGPDGYTTTEYWTWARAGWASERAIRYPMGKGAKPAYLLWEGEKLGYVDARLAVYWKLYRDAVARTSAFERLQTMVAEGQPLALFDFDGYDHDLNRVPLAAVLTDDKRPMGHAFVLKSMLLHGRDVTPEQVLKESAIAIPVARPPSPAEQAPMQGSLFDDPTPASPPESPARARAFRPS